MTEAAERRHPTRRRLLDWFLTTSSAALLASIVYPVLRFVSPPRVPEASTQEVEVGPANDPEFLDRGFKIVRFGQDPVIVIRLSAQDFRAFSATCTHLDCIVEFQPGQHRIFCNCHGGVYDLSGRNVSGPPPRPLKRFQVRQVAQTGQAAPRIFVSRA